MSDFSSIFDKLMQDINAGVESAMREAGDEIVEEMRNRLISDGHAGTGELLDSIQASFEQDGDTFSLKVTSSDVAKFIDGGTGAAHGVSGGREGSWRYRDKNGNWHTTDGMDADPFIDESLDGTLSSLKDIIMKHMRQGG